MNIITSILLYKIFIQTTSTFPSMVLWPFLYYNIVHFTRLLWRIYDRSVLTVKPKQLWLVNDIAIA